MAVVYEALTEPDTVTYNGPNPTVNMVDPHKQNDPGTPIDIVVKYVAAGDTNSDGTMDDGETFEVSWDGGLTWETATVTYNYTPHANSDSHLMVFEVAGGTQYVYNLGVPGNDGSNPAKVEGGTISAGHAQNGTLTTSEDTPFCFVAGTLIDTLAGQVAVETLNVGDSVKTVGNGNQKIRWIGRSVRRAKAGILPIRIKAGALGENTPSQELLVSPAHRMLVSGWRAELLFGVDEALVPAKALVNDDTITVARDLEEFEYFHIMFDDHEIVMSNGAPSESFQANAETLGTLDQDTLAEIMKLFPESELNGFSNKTARPVLSAAEASLLR